MYEFGFRLYDPWAGVWLTREPLPGRTWEPRTWHRYQYAYASPISYYDPYGLQVPPPRCEPGEICYTGTLGPYTLQSVPQFVPPLPEEVPFLSRLEARIKPPEPQILGFRNRSPEELLAYQEDQGFTNYCAPYAISTALNMLYGINTTGMDIVDAIQAHQFLPLLLPPLEWQWWWDPVQRPWPYYSWLPDGGAITPIQQVRVVNELAPSVLEKYGIHSRIQAEARALSIEEMVQTLQNPNQVVLFTYPTDLSNPFMAHVIVLAAYNRETAEFGFLNSGWERNPTDLTWKSVSEIEALTSKYPTIFIRPQFVVITIR